VTFNGFTPESFRSEVIRADVYEFGLGISFSTRRTTNSNNMMAIQLRMTASFHFS